MKNQNMGEKQLYDAMVAAADGLSDQQIAETLVLFLSSLLSQMPLERASGAAAYIKHNIDVLVSALPHSFGDLRLALCSFIEYVSEPLPPPLQ